MRNLLCWCLAIPLTLTVAGCRFRAPSGAEGQHLRESGAFPGDVPAWVNQNKDTKPRPTESAGFIPQGRVAPRLADPSGPEAAEELQEEEERQDSRARSDRTGGDDETGLGSVDTRRDDDINPSDQKSPLARIEETCPGLEASAVEALETTNPSERIRKYSALTVRCSDSYDLWLWLAKDYESQGRLVEAARSYERVLILDPANKEARERAAKVREQLNRPSGAAPSAAPR